MVSIIDYDAGNIKSVEKALQYLGEEAVVTRDKDVILSSDKVILPGVGSFGDAMNKIRTYGLDRVIYDVTDRGIPFLGICLGLQLMFESSEESPGVRGLGLLPGRILRIPEAEGLKIPHMGWNSLDVKENAALFRGLGDHPYVYFVHSYYAADCDDAVIATTDYGAPLTAAVASGNVCGCQFHPEKSGSVGLRILRAFCEMEAAQ